MSYTDPEKRRAASRESMRRKRAALKRDKPQKRPISIEQLEDRLAATKHVPQPITLPEPERVEVSVPPDIERQVESALEAGKHPKWLDSLGDQWLKQARKKNPSAVKASGLRNRSIRERDLAAIEASEVPYEE